MLKATIRRSISHTAARLPRGLRSALWTGLIQREGGADALFRKMAAERGIIGVIATGSHGDIKGSPDDDQVLPQYARRGTWATGANQQLVAFFAEHGGTYIDVGANIGLT